MDVWPEVKNLEGSVLRTLDRRNPFEVSYVGNDMVIVTPLVSGKGRSISRETVQSAFDALLAIGELSRVEIQRRYSRFNPAYVAALLSKCTGVSYNIRPIRIHFRGGG
jgi:hypothetical protein